MGIYFKLWIDECRLIGHVTWSLIEVFANVNNEMPQVYRRLTIKINRIKQSMSKASSVSGQRQYPQPERPEKAKFYA